MTPISAATRTNSGSSSMVSLRPVSQADTRGVACPSRSCRVAERLHVAQDAPEIVLAAHLEVGLRRRGIERDAQLVETGRDQRASVPLVQHRAVGVEQHVGAAVLQIADHPRQVLHQHRLADPMQHGARQFGHLIDDAREQLPRHVGRRLELRISARTGGAQQVAAVGHLQVEADRGPVGDAAFSPCAGFEIAARVDGFGSGGATVSSSIGSLRGFAWTCGARISANATAMTKGRLARVFQARSLSGSIDRPVEQDRSQRHRPGRRHIGVPPSAMKGTMARKYQG